jgi:hypothetical protein
MTLDRKWHTGAEIGVYKADGFLINDKILKSASFTLTKTDDGTVLIRNRKVENQYWINAFVPGRNDVAANLRMDITLEFKEEENAKLFYVSLEESTGYLIEGKNYFPSNTLDRQKRRPDDVQLVPCGINGCIIDIVFK